MAENTEPTQDPAEDAPEVEAHSVLELQELSVTEPEGTEPIGDWSTASTHCNNTVE